MVLINNFQDGSLIKAGVQGRYEAQPHKHGRSSRRRQGYGLCGVALCEDVRPKAA